MRELGLQMIFRGPLVNQDPSKSVSLDYISIVMHLFFQIYHLIKNIFAKLERSVFIFYTISDRIEECILSFQISIQAKDIIMAI